VNTPAHLVVNLALLSSSRLSRTPGEDTPLPNAGAWIAFGAVLPDAPMFGFFLWQTLVVGASQDLIWGEAYFRESWQIFFDLFNSIPLALAGLAIALLTGARRFALLFASVLLHCAFDLPLHHEDAHAHFLPLSSWHFESPVSYWDPKRLGQLGAGFELGVVLLSSFQLWRRTSRKGARAALALLCVLYVAGYVGFYAL
jgi:hypothetical protein